MGSQGKANRAIKPADSLGVGRGSGLIFLLSVPNLIIAFLLGLLVFLNMAVAVYSYSLSKVCRLRPGFEGLLGFLPSLFAGVACCVPTFLIALGPVLASFTVFFIKLRPFLIPVSFILMIAGLIWSIRKIPQESLQIFEESRQP